MIDTTKWTGFARISTDPLPLGWCAVGLLAAALGGPPPSPTPRAHPSPRVRMERVESHAAPQPIGVLVGRLPRVVIGHVDPCGADARDEFALTASAPCLVRFRLKPTLPGAELELHVRNRGELGSGMATGVVAFPLAGETRALEIGSAWGSSSYSLELEAVPLPARAHPAGRSPTAR